MFCANCFSVCPSMPISDALNDGVSIWVGGKVSNARAEPMFSKLAIPYIPNNPPRWPEVTSAVVDRIAEIQRASWMKRRARASISSQKFSAVSWLSSKPPTSRNRKASERSTSVVNRSALSSK